MASWVERAVRDLRAFGPVSLAAGETKTVTLTVPVADLAYFDIAADRCVGEPLEYVAEVGTSSRDLPLAARGSPAARPGRSGAASAPARTSGITFRNKAWAA